MEFAHAVPAERLDLLDGDAGRDHPARLVIVVEARKAFVQPARNARAARFRKAQHLWKAGDRENSRHDRCVHPGRRESVAKAQERDRKSTRLNSSHVSMSYA